MAVKFELSDDLGDESARGATPSIDIMSPVTLDDIYTPRIVDDDAASSVANEDMEFDENLAAELEQGLEELEDEAEEDDDDEEDEDDDDDDDDDRPSNERSMRMKLLGEDIAELERTIKKKVADLDSAPNPIIRRRFEGVIKQLQEQLSEKQLELEQYQKQVQEENDAELAESLAEKEPENSKTS
ncbi:hypothetical protein GGI07_003121 [Coemansia sp. Benny D115]|nr:hypothetical protein GGI07_003121 [Coemansia sp. Benny D115]